MAESWQIIQPARSIGLAGSAIRESRDDMVCRWRCDD